MKRVFMALGLLGLSTACGEGTGGVSPQAVTAPQVVGPVVARVNGEAIGLEEVRGVCEASGLSPDQALARLVDERVLAQYAESRGYGDLAESRRALAKARVRALLGESVEKPGAAPENRPESGQPAWEEQRERLESVVRDLRAKTQVVYDENAVREALANGGALSPGT